MDIEINKKTDNALFGRKDVAFTIKHDGETTPSRVQVRQLLAAEIGTKTENVVVDHMASTRGQATTAGTARAYESADLARGAERKHFLKRNNLFQEKKDGGDE